MKTLTLYERGSQIQSKIDAGTRVPASSSMMNSGLRRTQSKRALLEAIKQQREDMDQAVVFDAKF